MGLYNGRILWVTKASRRRALLLMVGALILISTGTVAPGSIAYAQQDQDVQDLILEARMGAAVITQGAVVLESQGRYYLPLIDISENFEFVITDSDVGRGYVQGWYIGEDNTFSVDREKKEAYHKGNRIELSEINFVDDPYGDNTDIFLQMEIFNQIWPEISFMVDLPTMQLRAESDATFPFMERKERKQRQEFLSARRATQTGPAKDLPYFRNPYGLISKPVIDIDTSFNWDNDARALTSQIGVNGIQDLAYMTAEYGLTATRSAEGFQRPNALRLTFLRETTPEEPLPFGIQNVELGDTRAHYREQIANGVGGRGIYFSTDENSSNREFDNITVEGSGPPGWEVELYRNNELIDFGIVDSTGEYRFEDVSTQYGNNRIRIVLYGPQGQVREEVKDYSFASNMLRPGQHHITGGMVDADRPFVRLDDSNAGTRPEGIAKSLSGSYGLNRNLTLFSNYNQLPTVEGDKSYVTAGTIFSAAGGYGQVEAYKGINNGHALDARFLTEIAGVRLNMVSVFFKDFESPTAGFGDNAKDNEQELKIGRNFRLPFGSLGLQFDASRIRRVNETTELSLRTRQTIGYSGIQFTHQTDTRLLDNAHQSSSGNLTANMRMRQWRLRGGLAYTYFPEAELNTGNIELRYQTRDDFIAAVNFQNDFVSDQIGLGFQVGYDFDKFLASVDTNWREQQGWEIMLRASTSLGPYGDDGGYNIVSESQRNLAPIKAQTFLDKNNNNLFDEGDEPLLGTRLSVDGRISEGESNQDGYVVARQSDRNGVVNVTVDTSSLEDPYYAPAIEGYSLSLRPGTMPYMEFPVIETGAIDGTIISADDGDPVQGINIQLVNEKGDIVAVTQAAYDGFYTFEFVRPGAYTIRVDPAYQVNVPPKTVTVASDDLFASGIDLELQEQVSEADGDFTVAEYDTATELASFDKEFEDAQAAQSAEGLVTVKPQSGAKSGRVAQPYHETQNGTSRPAPHSADGGFSAVVYRLRTGEHPDKVRFVMELSGTVDYQISPGAQPTDMVIDLPGVAWDGITKSDYAAGPVVQSFTTEALLDDKDAVTGTRIYVRGAQPIESAGQGLLPPDGKDGHRLFIDFRKI